MPITIEADAALVSKNKAIMLIHIIFLFILAKKEKERRKRFILMDIYLYN